MCNMESFEKDVKRYDPVSGIFEDIMSVSGIIKGIAFDHIGNNLYVTNTMDKSIKVHNVKTQAMTVFYFKDSTYSIALAPEERYGVELITLIVYEMIIKCSLTKQL